MSLALPQDYYDLAGKRGVAGADDTVASALSAATSRIEQTLGTTFERASRVDYFAPRSNRGVSPSHPQYLLNLTAGYLDAAVAVTVYYSNNGLPIMSPSDSHAVAYEANQVAIDFIKGRVTLNAAVPGAHFRTVAVAYTHGFETDEEGEGSYYIGVPDVLKWGCCVEAARIIASHPGRVTDKIPFKEIQSEYQRSAHRQLRNLIRQRIAGDDPQYTETV